MSVGGKGAGGGKGQPGHAGRRRRGGSPGSARRKVREDGQGFPDLHHAG